MFSKSKKDKIMYSPTPAINPPIKRYFKTAYRILKNAMEFDENGDYEVSKATLDVLKQHIDNYEKDNKIVNSKIESIANDLRPMTAWELAEKVKQEFDKDRPNTTSTNKDLLEK